MTEEDKQRISENMELVTNLTLQMSEEMNSEQGIPLIDIICGYLFATYILTHAMGMSEQEFDTIIEGIKKSVELTKEMNTNALH